MNGKNYLSIFKQIFCLIQLTKFFSVRLTYWPTRAEKKYFLFRTSRLEPKIWYTRFGWHYYVFHLPWVHVLPRKQNSQIYWNCRNQILIKYYRTFNRSHFNRIIPQCTKFSFWQQNPFFLNDSTTKKYTRTRKHQNNRTNYDTINFLKIYPGVI